MGTLLIALLATLLAGIGARDQLTVAALSARQGQRPALLIVALTIAVATALAAGLLEREALGWPTHAQHIAAAIILAVAGAEMLLLAPRKAPTEPTASLFAAGIVLLADSVVDPARLTILAVALALGSPAAAALGGVGATMATVTIGWLAAGALPLARLRLARRGLGGGWLAVAALMAWSG